MQRPFVSLAMTGAVRIGCFTTIAVRSGGFTDEALSGAVAIYDDVAALLADFDRSPINR